MSVADLSLDHGGLAVARPARQPASIPRTALERWRSLAIGGGVAGLWAIHAAAYALPGRAYFRITALNDISRPVGLNVVLQPALVCAFAIGVIRFGAPRGRTVRGWKAAIGPGLACWLLGATFSAALNASTDQVVLTFCTVFLAGAAVYLALQGLTLTPAALDLAVLGLVAGSLFPLIGGLQAFVREWGVLDATGALNAYLNLARMEGYEAVTFGNRGNTAGFIVIVAPVVLWVALDAGRRAWVRALCAAALVPIALNLIVLQVRAAFLTLLFSLAVVWGFRFGAKRFPSFFLGLVVSSALLAHYSPDVTQLMSDRLRPVVTADAADDASLLGRTDAMKEGLAIAERNWMVGIGPGGALTRHSQTSAHQFQLQQFMEAGVLGLIGSLVFSLGVLILLARTLSAGHDRGTNSLRFALIVGPASYIVYGLLANAAVNVGYVNTWAILVVSMVALVPAFPRPGR